MSQREFFSYRFAVPGYTFVLFVIGMNYVPLLEVVKATGLDSAFGAFLAFLSLFTGSALGFLISQVWWWQFNRQGRVFGIKQLETAEKALAKKYGPEMEGLTDIEKRKRLGLVLDYIILQADENGDKLWKYSERRWDMYHVLSSVYTALIIAYVTGACVRVYFEVFLFQSSILRLLNAFCSNFWSVFGPELFAQLFFFAGFGILLWFVKVGKDNITEEYNRIIEAIVHSSSVERDKLRQVFPNWFKLPPQQET